MTGQSPAAGEKVKVGTRVQINVSRGVRPLTDPVGGRRSPTSPPRRRFRAPASGSRAATSTRPSPRGPSSTSSPAAGGTAPAGTTITLSVSKGPVDQPVPDVTNQAEGDAVATLEASGFTANVVREATEDPALEGFVIRQDPPGGRRAPQGSAVTIVIGQFTP